MQYPSVMLLRALSGRRIEFDSHGPFPLSRKMCGEKAIVEECRGLPIRCSLRIGLDFLTAFP